MVAYAEATPEDKAKWDGLWEETVSLDQGISNKCGGLTKVPPGLKVLLQIMRELDVIRRMLRDEFGRRGSG